jgi:lipopolysaccharide export system protein LptA
MRKVALPLLLAICTSVALAGTTQQTQSAEITITTGELTLSAEQVISDSTAGTIKARGNVNVDIRNGTVKIHADEVEVNGSKDMFDLNSRGSVQMHLRRDDGSRRTVSTNQSHLQFRRLN